MLWTLLIGLIVGAVAKFLMPGRNPSGFFITMALGIAGSLVATFIGRLAGLYSEASSAGFLMSVAGAMLLLFAYHKITNK